jgi:hypothetical protein
VLGGAARLARQRARTDRPARALPG